MSTSPEPITYNLTNIKDALMPTAIPGVWKLPLNTYINVSIDEWKECVAEIEKLCAEKWNVKSTYNPKPATLLCDSVRATNVTDLENPPRKFLLLAQTKKIQKM
ncbi:hypothetical protein BC941DRAFT_445711 [Chlamydoabsidia padenii]|nr:hypothetical protein BC941DRAFT_445711 [Chlamydoabsidia padenii]